MTRTFRPSDQTIAYLPSGRDDVFAVLARPLSEPNGVTVYQLWGGGKAPSSGLNEFRTRLTASLAERGFHVLRIDYRGAGESSGELPSSDLHKPSVDDALVGLRWLAEQGLHRVILIGNCFGSLVALHFAEHVPELMGVVFIAAPMRNFNRNAIKAQTQSLWAVARMLMRSPRGALQDPLVRLVFRVRLQRLKLALSAKRTDADTTGARSFLEPLERLMARRVPMLFSHGPDVFRDDWELAGRGSLRGFLDANNVEIHVLSDRPVPATLAGQDELINVLTTWSLERARTTAVDAGIAGAGERPPSSG